MIRVGGATEASEEKERGTLFTRSSNLYLNYSIYTSTECLTPHLLHSMPWGPENLGMPLDSFDFIKRTALVKGSNADESLKPLVNRTPSSLIS